MKENQLTIDELLGEANTNKPTCAACVRPSECEIWGHPVCYSCAADFSQRMPTAGDIAIKYGVDADSAAVMTAFTKRWLAWRKQERAA